MIKHTFFLYFLIIKNVFNKIRYDWARELTIAIAASVLVLLFFYIFNDFINEKMAGLAGPWRQRLGQGFTAAVLLCVTQMTQRIIHQLRADETAPLALARRLGEEPKALGYAAALASLSILAMGNLLLIKVRDHFAPQWDAGATSAAYWLLTALFYALAGRISRRQGPRQDMEASLLTHVAASSRLRMMIAWRLQQMLKRNRSIRFVLAIAALHTGLIALGSAWAMPLFAMVLLSMALSFWLAVPLAWQMRDDLDISWAERLWGVSHEDIMRTYHGMAYGTAFLAGLAVLIAMALGSLAHGTWAYGAVDTVKLVLIAATYPWLLPSLLFQIDARRPAIPLLTVFLLGLFVGTAIFAHWLAFILVPILARYADDAQKNRYYRA